MTECWSLNRILMPSPPLRPRNPSRGEYINNVRARDAEKGCKMLSPVQAAANAVSTSTAETAAGSGSTGDCACQSRVREDQIVLIFAELWASEGLWGEGGATFISNPCTSIDKTIRCQWIDLNPQLHISSWVNSMYLLKKTWIWKSDLYGGRGTKEGRELHNALYTCMKLSTNLNKSHLKVAPVFLSSFAWGGGEDWISSLPLMFYIAHCRIKRGHTIYKSCSNLWNRIWCVYCSSVF